jgi:hypothetical protein
MCRPSELTLVFDDFAILDAPDIDAAEGDRRAGLADNPG